MNLIEDRGLGIDAFSEGYMDGSDPAATPDYSALTTPGAYGATTGLPDTTTATLGSIRSLETINLIPNGDFEDGTTNPWILTGFAPGGVNAPSSFTIASTGDLTGSYVSFTVLAGEGAALDLDALSTIPVATGERYYIQYVAKRAASDTTITLDHGDDTTRSYLDLNGGGWSSPGPDDGSTPRPEAFPDSEVPYRNFDNMFTIVETPNYLYVGSTELVPAQTGFLDDVRVGREDNLPLRQLPLPVDGAGALDLVAGRYTFTVYVKSEVASQITPTTPNRFRAGQIGIGANGDLELFTAEDAGWSDSEWVKISTVVELTPEEIAAGTSLNLQLATGTAESPTVGSLLVALPSLTLGTAQ